MPFQKGQVTNPGGRTRRYWIHEKQRVIQARKSFQTLIEIRDGRIKEEEVDKVTGERYSVAASVKEVRESCKSILAYAVGLPRQEIELSGSVNREDNREALRKVAEDQAAVDLTRQFAELMIHNGNGASSQN